MKRLIASSLATLLTTLAVAPALAEPPRKTELISLDGVSVDNLPLQYGFNGVWVVDNQNILYRDDSRTYYLVTLQDACSQLDRRGRDFAFHPTDPRSLLATRSYEVRPEAGPHCDVARIERLVDDRGIALRTAAQRRVW